MPVCGSGNQTQMISAVNPEGLAATTTSDKTAEAEDRE